MNQKQKEKNSPQLSLYDPTRKTVGSIYLEAQKNNTDEYVTNGDLTNEIQSSLIEDLNDTIQSKPFGERAFYITVHESKDLQMPRAIRRRILTSIYRPWPEDDTIVFWTDPKANLTKFCWCLPHWSEMTNMLANENLFDKEMISQIKAWKAYDLYHFGFCKNDDGNWMANPFFDKDRNIETYRKKVNILIPSVI